MKRATAMLLSRKIVANEVVTIRVARGGNYAPLVIPLPRSIADAMKCKRGIKVHIFTDGERGYFEKLPDPKL
ncbi:MAG TPA: hypothetical protein VKA95_00110 [Nitrososphaeraceae archaeon]|nr:hypothetical protein [Nitrososphaeraceae archaeon]